MISVPRNQQRSFFFVRRQKFKLEMRLYHWDRRKYA